MTTLGRTPTGPLLFNAAVDFFCKTPATLHADLGLQFDASANDVVADSAKCSFGKVRITDELASAVTQQANAAPDFAVSRSGLINPIRSQAIVLRCGISTLQILIPRLCFLELLTQAVDATETQESH